jgi:hypothetical protein
LKVYKFTLERVWYVSAPDDLPKNKVEEEVIPEFLNTDLSDFVDSYEVRTEAQHLQHKGRVPVIEIPFDYEIRR